MVGFVTVFFKCKTFDSIVLIAITVVYLNSAEKTADTKTVANRLNLNSVDKCMHELSQYNRMGSEDERMGSIVGMEMMLKSLDEVVGLLVNVYENMAAE